jgi:hypothetical protein
MIDLYVIVVHEATSELETRDLGHLIIYRKHQQPSLSCGTSPHRVLDRQDVLPYERRHLY